jgi:central kinetochore subunit Mal2/MCM21
MPQDEPMHQLEVVVRYADLQSDRLVDDTRPTGLFSMTGSVDEEQDDFEGLRRPYGQVRVHMLEYAPELDTRQRRTPGISRADLGALRPETVRRQDLELLYAQAHDGEALDMDDAFQRVAQRVWSQRAKSSVR